MSAGLVIALMMLSAVIGAVIFAIGVITGETHN
jgi:hypothetical protein